MNEDTTSSAAEFEADFRSRANADDAVRAFHAYREVEWHASVSEIGRGEDRTAYLVNGIVYKIGLRDTANPYDHETLEAARLDGMPWAPPSALFQVVDGFGASWDVMAMPYIEDDGSTADPDAMERMWRETGGKFHVDSDNYRVINGQPIVIDGCTVTRGAWIS